MDTNHLLVAGILDIWHLGAGISVPEFVRHAMSASLLVGLHMGTLEITWDALEQQGSCVRS